MSVLVTPPSSAALVLDSAQRPPAESATPKLSDVAGAPAAPSPREISVVVLRDSERTYACATSEPPPERARETNATASPSGLIAAYWS